MSIDAPISGGEMGAKNGNLVVMMGSDDQKAIEKVLPMLKCYSQE